MPEKIKVQVDESLKDLIPKYLIHRKEDAEKIGQFLAVGDIASVQRIGHKIKGTALSYGFVGLETIGKSIELFAKENNEAEIRKMLSQLTEYLANIEIVYNG